MHLPRPSFDANTTFAELALETCRLMRQGRWAIFIALSLTALWILWAGYPGLFTFAALSVGTMLIFSVWQTAGGGVPLLPLIALQTLVVYGVPIATNNACLQTASADTLARCGLELLVFQLALAGSWYACRQMIPAAPPRAWLIDMIVRERMQGLTHLGFWLAGGSTAFEVAGSMGWLDPVLSALPAGSYSVLSALTSAAAMAGFFVLALCIGGGHLKQGQKGFVWTLFVSRSLVSALSLLLSVPIMDMAALATGFLWGGGRFPWRFLIICAGVLAFLNLGKADMRERYWAQSEDDAPATICTAVELPARYAEWAQLSLAKLQPAQERGYATPKERQTLLDRIDNLQNLIFVVKAVDGERQPTLDGATYWLIPPLLVPRLFWPDKPRAHEGQVLLNTHFGRQSLEDSYKTYIAWGLLPEAYGNFGAWWGSLFLGCVLGGFCAWLEVRAANKPIFSLEGFLTVAVLLGLVVSFEMVASVLFTSQFQRLVLIIGAAAPFVRHAALTAREAPAAR